MLIETDHIIQERFLEEKKELCSHLLNEEIADQKNFDYLNFLHLKGYILENNHFDFLKNCKNVMMLIFLLSWVHL